MSLLKNRAFIASVKCFLSKWRYDFNIHSPTLAHKEKTEIQTSKLRNKHCSEQSIQIVIITSEESHRGRL